MVRRYGIDTHRIRQANLPHKDGCLTPSLARLEVAVALYRDGKASMGKAAGIAGVPRMQFQQELCSRGVE